MIVLVGLGLSGEQDLTLKAVSELKSCSEVYLENYTSLAPELKIKKLENIIGKKVKKLGREEVEVGGLVKKAKTKKIGLIVIGDPLVATTHSELILEAKKNKIKHGIIHNASVLTVVCEAGLQAYKFGKTLSVPFHEAESYLRILKDNHKIGAHTLCLLDLDLEKKEFLPVKTALKNLRLKGSMIAAAIALSPAKSMFT